MKNTKMKMNNFKSGKMRQIISIKDIIIPLGFNLILLISTIAFNNSVNAQTVPTPGDKQSKPILLMNGTAHIGNGEVIQNSIIGFENGKITLVDYANKVKIDPEYYETINCRGMHIYPGLIAIGTDVGLTEISAVRATNDFREVGLFNPNVRSIIAYNTDSQITPTLRSNGILLAQVLGGYGRIRSTSSVVQLDAWNYEDAVVKEDDAIWLNWPTKWRYKGWWSGGGVEENKGYKKQMNALTDFFNEAEGYCSAATVEKINLKFEAMCSVFNKDKKVFIEADDAKDIIAAIDFKEKYGLDIVIFGASQAHLITDLLVEKNIPIVIENVNALPNSEDDNIYLPFELPKLFEEAGVLYAVTSDNDSGNTRNLAFNLGTAVAHGLDKESALKAMTLNAAKILGIDNMVGSLERGKQATLIISEGEIMDIKQSNVFFAFIDGRKVDLGNKQKDLYYKFMKKYGLNAEAY